MSKKFSSWKSTTLGNVIKWMIRLLVTLIIGLLGAIILLRWINPPTTAVIMSETRNLKNSVNQEWTPLESLGNNISLAVVASEDANFCNHHGFDLSERRLETSHWSKKSLLDMTWCWVRAIIIF